MKNAHCEYVTNYINRRGECGYLMLAAVGLTSFVTFIASKVGVTVPVALLSPFLISGALILAWENWVWRIASRFGYPLPNLNGKWTGKYRLRSGPEAGKERNCSMTIHQTWSRMKVTFESGEGYSHSTLIALNTDAGRPKGLGHLYEWHSDSKEAKHTERHGFCRILPIGETSPWDEVAGWFYDPSRQGTMSMSRSGRKTRRQSATKSLTQDQQVRLLEGRDPTRRNGDKATPQFVDQLGK